MDCLLGDPLCMSAPDYQRARELPRYHLRGLGCPDTQYPRKPRDSQTSVRQALEFSWGPHLKNRGERPGLISCGWSSISDFGYIATIPLPWGMYLQLQHLIIARSALAPSRGFQFPLVHLKQRRAHLNKSCRRQRVYSTTIKTIVMYMPQSPLIQKRTWTISSHLGSTKFHC